MPFRVMGHRRPAPLLQGQPWLSAAQGLDLNFLVSTEDQSFVWRIQAEPNHIRQLLHELGSRLSLKVRGRCGLSPWACQTRYTVFGFTPTTGARVRVVQCVATGGKVVVVRVTMRWIVTGRRHGVRTSSEMSAAFGSIPAARRLHARLQMVSFAAPQKPSRQVRCR